MTLIPFRLRASVYGWPRVLAKTLSLSCGLNHLANRQIGAAHCADCAVYLASTFDPDLILATDGHRPDPTQEECLLD